jgi:hypothetical protein
MHQGNLLQIKRRGSTSWSWDQAVIMLSNVGCLIGLTGALVFVSIAIMADMVGRSSGSSWTQWSATSMHCFNLDESSDSRLGDTIFLSRSSMTLFFLYNPTTCKQRCGNFRMLHHLTRRKELSVQTIIFSIHSSTLLKHWNETRKTNLCNNTRPKKRIGCTKSRKNSENENTSMTSYWMQQS